MIKETIGTIGMVGVLRMSVIAGRRADVITIETKRNREHATITNIDFLNLKLIMDGYYIAETSYESLFVLVLLFRALSTLTSYVVLHSTHGTAFYIIFLSYILYLYKLCSHFIYSSTTFPSQYLSTAVCSLSLDFYDPNININFILRIHHYK